METGRGAWRLRGKDNGTTTYAYVPGFPMDGSSKADADHKAVKLGVQALQGQLVGLGYLQGVTGVYDQATANAVKTFQIAEGSSITNGRVGEWTAPRLVRDTIVAAADELSVDPKYIHAIAMKESRYDFGAVGELTPGDRGIYQFNTLLGFVSVKKAHDVPYATLAVTKRFAAAWKKYRGKGKDLREICSLAQHNAPAWADQWFATGYPPNEKIQDYATKALDFTEGWIDI
jgi:hypothetical protein